jgi:hypothetical protein
MQLTARLRQARPRAHPLDSLRFCARHLGAVAGELLALTSLVVALGAGLMTLGGLLG